MPIRSTLPALDPALQLLLLLARLELSEEQEASARALCARIDDWPGLAQQANQRFVLPLAYRHLLRLAPENLPPEQLDAMKGRSLAVVKLNLLVAAAQHRLQTELLIPLEVPHVFFKGPSLAARYYDDPALRFSRDIDLLVPPERLVLLLEAALSKGYVSLMPKGLTTKREGLAYAAGAHHVFSLLSPDGVPIDLHQQIDCSGTIYATQQLLDGAESFVAGDAEIPVMSTAELFVYICLHHSKHHWSHLHWLVDLDAIQRHPSFTLEASRDLAARRNLTTTLEACLAMHRALAASEPWKASVSGHGRAMLGACLMALQGGPEVELAMGRTRAAPDFAFAWQASTKHRLHGRMQGVAKLLRPTYADYHLWPLPPRWQWIYRLTCPFQKLHSRITTGRWRS
ncbi:nucleotidyltransferase family protein [Halomonas kalidii]|uniref:Nucleotidyltransferase family protein n=1 Tax=Halomonas kalidii TaxID=3043293 RepID=A0ABT6VLN3_9GAMM|nr:nucleotidyltransferase family protein [Halomonas kalidii]MDI5934187.1 nucleotidyltransferase family protein [Halomonas kalidii]